MDLAAGITAVTQGIGIAKTLKAIDAKYDEATYKAKLAEVISAFADAKIALSDAKEALSAKDFEIERLLSEFNKSSNLVTGPGNYQYNATDSGDPVGFPVCPRCIQLDGRVVEIKQEIDFAIGKCPICSNVYNPIEVILRYENSRAYTKRDQHNQQMEEKRQRREERHRLLNQRNRSWNGY